MVRAVSVAVATSMAFAGVAVAAPNASAAKTHGLGEIAETTRYLQNEWNNKCLFPSESGQNGAPVAMLTCHGNLAFAWYWDGQQIRNRLSGKCLEILSFHNENGALAGVWDCWGGANQKWYWDGQQIRSAMNNRCLELLYFHDEDGANVGMWDCWGGANQRWTMPRT